MSFTRIPYTTRGGWSAVAPTNDAFVQDLTWICNDAYDRHFQSHTALDWRIYMSTGIVEYLDRDGMFNDWHYVGRFDLDGKFVADAQADPFGYTPQTDGVYDDEVDATTGCCGHGLFFNGGGTVNGVYTGSIDKCFPCGGKGFQTRDDRTRNAVYNAKYRRVYA